MEGRGMSKKLSEEEKLFINDILEKNKNVLERQFFSRRYKDQTKRTFATFNDYFNEVAVMIITRARNEQKAIFSIDKKYVSRVGDTILSKAKYWDGIFKDNVADDAFINPKKFEKDTKKLFKLPDEKGPKNKKGPVKLRRFRTGEELFSRDSGTEVDLTIDFEKFEAILGDKFASVWVLRCEGVTWQKIYETLSADDKNYFKNWRGLRKKLNISYEKTLRMLGYADLLTSRKKTRRSTDE
jgi:hypothetical protein